METKNNNIKTCENCNRPDGEVKFQKYRKICNSCNSKHFNDNHKLYFREYYHEKELYKKTGKSRGRPRKNFINLENKNV